MDQMDQMEMISAACCKTHYDWTGQPTISVAQGVALLDAEVLAPINPFGTG